MVPYIAELSVKDLALVSGARSLAAGAKELRSAAVQWRDSYEKKQR